MTYPGVVPNSAEAIPPVTDNDGNTLYTIACMKDQAPDYIKVLKKNGFQSQQFDYDPEGWLRSKNLKTQLELEL